MCYSRVVRLDLSSLLVTPVSITNIVFGKQAELQNLNEQVVTQNIPRSEEKKGRQSALVAIIYSKQT